jgi:hypothetical protein
MIAAFVALALLFAPASMPSPSPAGPLPVLWQGVTLGEPTATAVARLGVPRSRRKAIMGTYLLEYSALGGIGTLLLTDGGGVITGIRLAAPDASALRAPVADPFGVDLGDTADRLSELRGQPARYDDEGAGEFTSYYGRPSDVRWAYGLRDGKVYSIGVVLPYRVVRASGAAVAVSTPRPGNAPTAAPADASALDRAIKVRPQDVASDTQFEYTYVQKTSCGTNDRWTVLGEAIFNARRHNYMRVDALCPSTGETRNFYFDITAVFGKGDR